MTESKDGNLERLKESGTAMVEAAIAMPIFLAILFISMYLMLLSFKILRFQYELSDITRQTFLLTPSQRAAMSGTVETSLNWGAFWYDQIDKRLKTIGLTTQLESNYKLEVTLAAGRACSDWVCASEALPGDVVSITVTLKEPVFGPTLAGVSWQVLSINTKAIAFVSRPQDEEE